MNLSNNPRNQELELESYAQTLILVKLIVVNIVGFLVITRNPVGISGPYEDTSFLSSTRTSLYPPIT